MSTEEAPGKGRKVPTAQRLVEGTTEALIIVIAAVVVNGAAVLQCYEYEQCHEAGTARTPVGGGPTLSCSFTNYVSVSGDVLYGYINNTGLLSLTRSVCWGERLHQLGQRPERVRAVALVAQCAQRGDHGTERRGRHARPDVGAWIDAGPWRRPR